MTKKKEKIANEVPAAVTEAVDAIMTQTGLGQEFRADIEKNVLKAHDAGSEIEKVEHISEPLTAAEIAVIRDGLRGNK